MIQLPRLQESLLLANDRMVARARRRARRLRLGLVTSAAVVSLGGAAVAGTAVWGPELGFEDGNRPTAAPGPVPPAQSGTLGVLRREQTAGDRGPVARAALAAAGRRYVGVRLDGVRVLHRPTATTGVVLVPVADLAVRRSAPSRPGGAALCLHTQEVGDSADVRCVTTEEVRRGEATGVVGPRAWGLVPDGVARVTVADAAGRRAGAAVTDNLFVLPVAAVAGGSGVVTWVASDGRAITPEGGAPMRLPEVPAARAAVPAGQHDCGVDRGGIVPVDVDCGSDAVRWGAEFHPRPLDDRP